jgi:hypothetical protein
MNRLIARLLGRKQTKLPPFDHVRNRFPAKKKWPPNLHELTDKQNFRFERKYKRRIKLKAIRPEWNRKVTVVTWSLISFIVVYGVFFYDFANDPMNPRPGEQPFKALRKKMWDTLGGFYTHTDATIKGERGARRVEPLENHRAAKGEGGEGGGPSPIGR